jgi:hypothetical protein
MSGFIGTTPKTFWMMFIRRNGMWQWLLTAIEACDLQARGRFSTDGDRLQARSEKVKYKKVYIISSTAGGKYTC